MPRSRRAGAAGLVTAAALLISAPAWAAIVADPPPTPAPAAQAHDPMVPAAPDVDPYAPATPAQPDPYANSAADPVSGADTPLTTYLMESHAKRSVGDQVQEVSAVDPWAKAREGMLRTMLDYEIGRSSTLGTAPVAGPLLAHLDATHWNRSPAEQASDLANADNWLKSHELMTRMMLDPVIGAKSALGTAPGTGPVLAHLDKAHWDRSPARQVADASDVEGYLNAHAPLVSAVVDSFGAHPPAGRPAK